MIKLTDTERAAILADARDNAEGAGVGDTLRLLADYDALERELDAALAELAALKGRQEAVAWRVTGKGGLTVTPQYPSWAEDDSRLLIEPLYTAPPAQASAWVPEGSRKVFICRDCEGVYSDEPVSQCDCTGREIYDEGYIVMLAPTPGASDGRE